MEKKPVSFNIIKTPKTHEPNNYGLGSLSLENISPVIIDVTNESATIDVGALHARSAVEKGIKFVQDQTEVVNGKLYWLIWVTVDKSLQGSFYAGITACSMLIDDENRRGYKNLPEHVNAMDKSMKRKIAITQMDTPSKQILKQFLINYDLEMWQRSDEKIWKAFD